jgi:Ankyrin repeats (3 copies)
MAANDENKAGILAADDVTADEDVVTPDASRVFAITANGGKDEEAKIYQEKKVNEETQETKEISMNSNPGEGHDVNDVEKALETRQSTRSRGVRFDTALPVAVAELPTEDLGAEEEEAEFSETDSEESGSEENVDSANEGNSDEEGEDEADDGKAMAASLEEMPKGLIASLLSGGKLGSKPLHAAAGGDDADELNKLLAKDAEWAGSVDDLDAFEYTPLHVAAEAGSTKAVIALIKHGADLELQTKFHSSRAIHYAAFGGHVDVCRLLLDADADVDSRTDDLRTPLYQASFRGHADCIRVLLAAGADCKITTRDGKSACDVAKDDKCRDLLEQPSQKKARTSSTK